MEQLAGGGTAFHVSPMMLEEDAVGVKPVGAEGTAEHIVESPSTSMPLIMG